MSGALLIAGTGSDAGKSVIATGVCRWLRRRGLSVAPFKGQNMALNSAVTPDGCEIGRAQAAQAAAAGVAPEAAMNPVLLKPSGERMAQVVLMGKVYAEVDANAYAALRPQLREHVLAAFSNLRERFDVVVCEGAGSPAEINLRTHDLVNMGLARAGEVPVIVVGDIDRGGVFASLYGTLALLEPADQRLIAGFVINKFRGDRSILEPGERELERLTGRPIYGVLPWVRGLWLDVEDSLALESPRDGARAPLGRDALDVAVIRLPWISNFTDFDALACEPGVSVRFTYSPADVERADLAILPGTKATVADLDWLRTRGLAPALAARAARGDPVLGVCGGYQMLGRRIVDAVESGRGAVDGLGLLPVSTEFAADKLLRWRDGTAAGVFGRADVSGYEIHHGAVTRSGAEPLLTGPQGEEGCVHGAVLGTTLHGVLEGDAFRRALLAWVADRRSLRFVAGAEAFAGVREARHDALADLVEEHLDTDLLLELIAAGAPADLPVLTSSISTHVSSP